MYRHHVNKTATNASVAKRNVLLDEDNDSGLSSGGRLDFTMTFSVIEEERLLDTMDYEDCECDSALGFDMEEEVAATQCPGGVPILFFHFFWQILF